MKKLLSIASLLATSSAFAAFTVDTAQSSVVITGSGNSSELSAELATKGETVYKNGEVVTPVAFNGTSLNFDDSFFVNTSATSYIFKTKNSTITFGENGYLIMRRALEVNGNSTITIGDKGGIVFYNQGIDERRIFVTSGTLTLNLDAANAFIKSSPNHEGKFAKLDLMGGSAILNITGDQHMDLRIRDTGANNLTLNVKSGGLFIETWDIGATYKNDRNITIAENGLENGALYFLKDTSVTLNTDGTISKTSGDLKQTFTLVGDVADLKFDTVNVGGTDYIKFWTGAAIPEPAEWAAIFGAIALGFAIYRRRK